MKYKGQDLLCKLELLASGYAEEELEELKNSKLLQKYHENEDLSSLLRDEPFFCGIDIEPYIYLAGTEASQEVTVSDESVLAELLSGDSMEMRHAADAINEMADSEKQQFLNVVIPKLKEAVVVVRRNVAGALGEIGDTRAVEALIEALKDRDESVRKNTVEALGEIGDARAVEALIEALEYEAVVVRERAAWALGRIGDVSAVEALIEALNDRDESVREHAAWALISMGDMRAVEALIEALEYEAVVVRERAAWALGRIGDVGAVKALKNALLKDRDESVRMAATRALKQIKAKQN